MDPDQTVEARIALTASCTDAESIPKVPEAGAVRTENGTSVQIMHNGVRIVEDCYCGAWMTEIIRKLRGHHEPQEERAFYELLGVLARDTDAPVMVELGSYWAYYSLWMLDRFPSARTIMVEPDPERLAIGQRNFALNGRSGEFVQAAIDAEARPPAPFLCERDETERLVATESLPSLLTKYSIDNIDLLLADIQGFELPLLEGAREVIADTVRFLVVSTHHHSISGDPLTHDRCLALLRELGAHIICEHTVHESFSGDGLIVASFDARDNGLLIDLERARTGDGIFRDPLYDLADLQALLALRDEQLAVALAQRDRALHAHDQLAASRTVRFRNRLAQTRIGRFSLRVLHRARPAR